MSRVRTTTMRRAISNSLGTVIAHSELLFRKPAVARTIPGIPTRHIQPSSRNFAEILESVLDSSPPHTDALSHFETTPIRSHVAQECFTLPDIQSGNTLLSPVTHSLSEVHIANSLHKAVPPFWQRMKNSIEVKLSLRASRHYPRRCNSMPLGVEHGCSSVADVLPILSRKRHCRMSSQHVTITCSHSHQIR